MALDRMLKAANDLVDALNLRGPEVVAHDNPSKHKIGEVDALRFIVKSLRELRHGVALGGQVDDGALSAMTDKMAAHLGVADKKAIKKALIAETDLFTKDFIDGVEKLGKHAHFHEDHGVIDSRAFPAEANNAPPPSSPLHRSHFEPHRKGHAK